MNKIQAMHKWSGGEDASHFCGECQNFVRIFAGNKKVFKCLAYGNTRSEASDWRKSYVACKHFDQPPPEIPVIRTIRGTAKQDVICPGQMEILDFIEEPK